MGVGSGAEPRVVRRLGREVESSDAMVASDISGDAVVEDDSRGCLSEDETEIDEEEDVKCITGEEVMLDGTTTETGAEVVIVAVEEAEEEMVEVLAEDMEGEGSDDTGSDAATDRE